MDGKRSGKKRGPKDPQPSQGGKKRGPKEPQPSQRQPGPTSQASVPQPESSGPQSGHPRPGSWRQPATPFSAQETASPFSQRGPSPKFRQPIPAQAEAQRKPSTPYSTGPRVGPPPQQQPPTGSGPPPLFGESPFRHCTSQRDPRGAAFSQKQSQQKEHPPVKQEKQLPPKPKQLHQQQKQEPDQQQEKQKSTPPLQSQQSDQSAAKQETKQPPQGKPTPQQEEQHPAPTSEQPVQPLAETGDNKKKKKKKKAGQGGAEKDADAASSSAPEKPSSSGAASKGAVEELGKDVQKKLTLESPKYRIPKRIMTKNHSPITCSKNRIEVNYLPITIKNWDIKLYHYDVTFNPDRPKSLFRHALKNLLRTNCPNRHPAFDGKKNVYAAGTPLTKGDTIRDSVELPDPDDANRQKTFDIVMKLTPQVLTMRDLKTYMERGESQFLPQDAIQATDIALRAGFYDRFIPCSRSFFSGPAGIDLGEGMELYDGFFQSAIVANKGAFLNVDVSNKAFPNDQTVVDYIRNTLGRDPRQPLDDYSKRDLHTYIKGLKVSYEIRGERRTYKVHGLGEDAVRYRFEMEGKGMTSVAEYFDRVKGVRLQFPHLPLLHVGPPQKKTMVPLELCRIIGNQVIMRSLTERQTAQMVRAAATSTDIRKQRIMSNIRNAKFNDSEVLTKEFGIAVDTKFAEVDSYVFKPPDIQYRQNTVTPNNGVWRMDRQNFCNTQNGIYSWAVLIKDGRTREDEIRKGLVALFKNVGRQMGLDISDPKRIVTSTGPRDQSEDAILNNLTSLNRTDGPLQIVVVILPGGGPGATSAYGNIKRASELKCGVLTQCLKSMTAVKKMNPMTAQNILLKMNAKINGVNHALAAGPLKPQVFKTPVMFVGADVTHPAPGSEGFPSIAAVAASFDFSGFKYKMMYHLQPSRREMIDDLEEIMVEQLKHFKNVNKGTLPVRIMYYRDGVSEGQFSQVLQIELDALRRACANKEFSNYKPLITFLVVQKRHHTRFFPRKQDGDGSRNNNVLAGTVVDTDITHPTEMDFYLVSHQSIQGTARPTKYHVLWDDSNLEGEDLEMLTYYLCYLFSRCNRSVSYPAPTYYAHLAAFRARAWWIGQRIDMTNLKAEQRSRGTIKEAICTETPMFFV